MTSAKRFLAAAFILFAASHASAALHVVATTPEYGAIAAVIGGDKVTVATLAKPTEDPHFVDAKPSHIVTLNRADVLIEGGADLEVGWLPPLMEGARNTKIASGAPGHFRASEGIQLLDVPAVLDRSQGDIHAAGNPHFMMDPHSARVVAQHFLADTFCGLDAGSCPLLQDKSRRLPSSSVRQRGVGGGAGSVQRERRSSPTT